MRNSYVLAALVLALLCTSTFALAESETQGPGFWTRFRAFFSANADVSLPEGHDAPAPAELAGVPGCIATTNTCWTESGEKVACEGSYPDCKEKYARCECGVPEDVPSTDDERPACDRCSAVVCETGDGKSFLCPSAFKTCQDRYGTCEQLGCLNEACTARKNLCWPQNQAGPTDRSVVCEGSYTACAEKYGKCECGVPETCEWNGRTYSSGESFPAGDGCNTCTCGEDGSVGCTKRACPACKEDADCARPCLDARGITCPAYACKEGSCVQITETVCLYDNQKRLPGETFKDTDGCNTCTCLESGVVTCTERACPVKECATDRDCPTITCVRAPCPVNVCADGVCVMREVKLSSAS